MVDECGSDSKEDSEAGEIGVQFYECIYVHSIFKDGRKGGVYPRFTITHLTTHTYHNHREDIFLVMEGPQSHSKEHQMGEQECKWHQVCNKSTGNKVKK